MTKTASLVSCLARHRNHSKHIRSFRRDPYRVHKERWALAEAEVFGMTFFRELVRRLTLFAEQVSFFANTAANSSLSLHRASARTNIKHVLDHR